MHVYGEISMLKNVRVCGRMHAWFTVFILSIICNSVTGPYNRDQHVYVITVLKKHEIHYICFKNSLIIHEENTKKNHKRVVSLYVDKDFPSFT